MKDLKERLIKIRDNEWNVPEDINRREFAFELLENIGVTDGELRDDLILNVLWVMIVNKMLEKDTVRELLDLSLSDKHLFKGLGKEESDDVFNRTFTILVIRGAIHYHQEYGQDLLSAEEVKDLNRKLNAYVRKEKDLRGYVEGKGWAHGMGHAGDTLRVISLCEELQHDDLLETIETVKEKICIYNYVYINEETERLASTVMMVLKRNLITHDEWVRWLNEFETKNIPEGYPNLHYFKENVKGFLRSLYFRIKFKDNNSALLKEIEPVLNRLNTDFNQII